MTTGKFLKLICNNNSAYIFYFAIVERGLLLFIPFGMWVVVVLPTFGLVKIKIKLVEVEGDWEGRTRF